MAIIGVTLPYVVSLCLVLAFKSIAGHTGYTVPATELMTYDRIVLNATWAAIAFSLPLTLPQFLSFIKGHVRITSSIQRPSSTPGRLVLFYACLLISNALAVLLFNGVVSMLTEATK